MNTIERILNKSFGARFATMTALIGAVAADTPIPNASESPLMEELAKLEVGKKAEGGTIQDIGAIYRVDTGDILSLSVIGVEELAQILCPVDEEGFIKFPYIEKLRVRGRSVHEVRDDIRRMLAVDLIVNPQVVAVVETYRDQSVIMMGAVNNPGLVPYPPEKPLTVIGAISSAGGFAPNANKKRIEVSRDGVTKSYSYDKLRETKNAKNIFYLKPNDIVTVKESFL